MGFDLRERNACKARLRIIPHTVHGTGDHTGTPRPTVTRGKLTTFAQGRLAWGRNVPTGSAGAQRVVLAGGHACHAWTAVGRGVLRRLVDVQLLTPPSAASHRLRGQSCESRKMRGHRPSLVTIGSLGRPYGPSAYLKPGQPRHRGGRACSAPGTGSVSRESDARQSIRWQCEEP